MKSHILKVKNQLLIEYPELHTKTGIITSKKSLGLTSLRKLQVTLVHPSITLESDFTRMLDLHLFKCSNCEYMWETAINKVVNEGTGCPSCAKVIPLSNSVVDTRLVNKSRTIKRLGDYTSSKSPILWECLLDGYQWKANTDNVLYKETGCPKCANCAKLTNEIIDKGVEGRLIKRITTYTPNNLVTWECLVDGHQWTSSVSNVMHAGTGCPKCAGREHDCLYVWNILNTNYYKIGISHSTKVNSRIKNCANKNNMQYMVVNTFTVDKARELETTLLTKFTNNPFKNDRHIEGYTEFRELTKKEIEEVIPCIVADHILKQQK